MSISEDSLIETGQIIGTHGLRGDLKVRPLSGDPGPLLQAEEFVLRLPGGQLQKVTPQRQALHKGIVLLRLSGFESLTDVEGLKGCRILLDKTLFPVLENDEFYWHQIQGSLVVDRQLGDIGRLASMFTTAAHDTWVVEGSAGEIMIPVVAEFVVSIDTEKKVIQVDLPEGLVEVDL
ncbi:ribosome maturation factor RimM [Geopsychrobacter electrodiphilus]|uniref:ribosome maturation factor RimM n=1 Tax=Geopsychrobacter electrodiphilus TaxID=225196 RepID=UPI00035C672B|nr:ribosome maturation factor RimM [Geopsychrobacter electrodiphilus]